MNNENVWYSQIIDQLKEIDTDKIGNYINEDGVRLESEMKLGSQDRIVTSTIIEKQKVYFWIRLYLKEELSDIIAGDDFKICYTPSGEFLNTKFVAFGKKNLNRDLDNEIINYDPEDNKKVLCLMVDEDDLKENSDRIPFIRSLFKTYGYYEFQIYHRDQLLFTNTRTGINASYLDVDF